MTGEPPLARVLVALDASPLSLAALQTATVLSRQSGAKVTGLFVEDVNLSRLAGHPAATSISLVGGLRRDPDHRILEHALKVQLAAVRRAFEEATGRLHGTTFLVRQGRVETELLAAATEADLVLVGGCGRPETVVPLARLGSIARAVVEGAARPVLVMRHSLPSAQPVAVLYDGSAAARRALALASRLAAATAARLDIITAAADAAAARAREAEARALIEPVTLALAAHPLTLSEAGRRRRALLVLPVSARHLLESLPCSVLVVP